MFNLFSKRPPTGMPEGLIKVRGDRAALQTLVERPLRRTWRPQGLNRVMLHQPESPRRMFSLDYDGGNRGAFYRWLRDNVPVISAGVWAWTRLCATELCQKLEGAPDARLAAAAALEELDRRILEAPYGRGSGLVKLTEGMFLELFTTGRFAGEAVLKPDGKNIDHLRFVDPYTVEWRHGERGWQPFIRGEDGEAKPVDAERFFYTTLGIDLTQPGGVEPLACIPFVAEIEQLMLEDMARSGHNAGNPRLQVKIARPAQFNWESDRDFENRANRYFQDVVAEFRDLDADDNIFSWSDVEVTVVGAGGVNHNWRLNREQVVEDVITGLKLFPWVLGRTHKTTQNWVQSQFDLLMQMVAAHQKSGADLVDWLTAMELRLRGINVSVRHRFSGHPDPFRLDRAQAAQIEFQNVDLKVQRGYISKDEGARELGYIKAFSYDER